MIFRLISDQHHKFLALATKPDFAFVNLTIKLFKIELPMLVISDLFLRNYRAINQHSNSNHQHTRNYMTYDSREFSIVKFSIIVYWGVVLADNLGVNGVFVVAILKVT